MARLETTSAAPSERSSRKSFLDSATLLLALRRRAAEPVRETVARLCDEAETLPSELERIQGYTRIRWLIADAPIRGDVTPVADRARILEARATALAVRVAGGDAPVSLHAMDSWLAATPLCE